ncbi:MAG: 3-oxoacyl-ACP reductase [Verrucomicrobia bacterium 61-8]|nr:SDR family oxidoreductase [Verrucomicrobiota bacterium]OJV17768.1 MAG: 3-oxoacyl-ACP reductase [Verrucomicrobia bacterium 61-8]
MFDFSARTVLVTGSTANLGYSIARAFARSGARVVVHGPNDRETDQAAARLKEEVPTALVEAISFDLGQQTQIDEAFVTLEKRGLLPDILINNAAHLGLGKSGFLEQTPDFFREVIEVNLFGTFRCSQLSAQGMAKRGGGAIITISSLAGERAIWSRSGYNTSKAALDGLMRSMALDLAPHGIRVNSISPGYVWTPRWNALSPDVIERRKHNIPAGEPTRQDEIARTVLFLASDAAPSLTGAGIIIDGGLSVQQVPKDLSI